MGRHWRNFEMFRLRSHWLLWGILWGLLTGCVPASAALPPSLTATVDSPWGVTRITTPYTPVEPTHTLVPSPSPSPTASPVPLPVSSPSLFPLQVPLPDTANRRVSPNYRFGTTMDGLREIHHGVEFENPMGTLVLAAADGQVVFAAEDAHGELSPWMDFYGNTVVLEHRLPGMETSLYTLYAHLSEIQVQAGQQVQAGEPLGLVGMSGSADGPHLHFEVRIGKNAYWNSSNPELWLKPDPGRGSLAGKLTSSRGKPLASLGVVLIPLDGARPQKIYLQTYAAPDAFISPLRDENFAIWNLPAGHYRLEFIVEGTLQRQEVIIKAGERTFVTFP